jgi:hypothetical protein
MRRRSRATAIWGVGLALAWVTGSGCQFDARSCTDVGCVTQATIFLQSPTGAWTPGTYELAVALDDGTGGSASCALQVPAAPSPTSPINASCTSEIGLTFLGDSQCRTLTSDSGDAVSGECLPVPGHFHQELSLPGTPSRVALTLSRDGHVLLQTTVNLAYQNFYPNGPQCGGSCQEASTTLLVGADRGDGGVDSGPAVDAGDAARE